MKKMKKIFIIIMKNKTNLIEKKKIIQNYQKKVNNFLINNS